MTQRRHAADCKAGDPAHEIGIGPADSLTDERRDLFLIDTVGPAGNDQ